MTEALFWAIFSQPVIAAVTILAFVQGSWKVRTRGAAIAFIVGVGIGLFAEWLKSQGVPDWLGWFMALPLAAYVFWHWHQARKTATRLAASTGTEG